MHLDSKHKRILFQILKYLNYLTNDNLREINNIIKKTNLDEIKKFKMEGVSIGEHANAGALRYHAKGYLDNTENELAILKKYFISALKTFFIAKNLFKSKKFDTVVLNHGIYVPQGIFSEVARKNNVNVVTWFTAYKNKFHIFINILRPVYDSLQDLSSVIKNQNKSLIGFVGAPWTLLVYMLNKKSQKKKLSKEFTDYNNKDKLIQPIVNYLKLHIKNQIDNVSLFKLKNELLY